MLPKQLFNENSPQAQEMNKQPKRQDLSPEFQWHLEDIFATDDAWEKTFKDVETQLPQFEAFKGTLGQSAGQLLAALRFRDTVEEKFSRLYLYAGLKNDQDTRVSKYQGYRSRVTGLMVKLNQATSFIQPEILAIPEKTIERFLTENSELAAYRHQLEDLLRSKAHILSPEQERLLAMTGELADAPYRIFSMFDNADLKFPTIVDENGQQVEVTKGRYARFMESNLRRVREDAFHAFYQTYGKWTNTLAATLSAAINRDIFKTRSRHYANALEAALHPDNIPVSVYENVVNSINDNLHPLHRLMALRKKMLRIDELHPWDLMAPLVDKVDFDIPYPRGREIVREALQPLGDDYLQILDQSLNGGWIDVYENQGKRSGAYSWSTYGVHPYVLLNYQNRLDDIFTLAHELGHALHSYHTQAQQPYHYGHYTIFVAEVASTLNEALLNHHLLQTETDPLRRLYLLNKQADSIRGTVYNQTLFAEFEKQIHQMAEQGQPLTVDALSQLNRELYQRYLGPEFVMDAEYDINWCRIPHFYYNFYVYKYVTGFSAATALSRKILAGDSSARESYLRFLASGCSDYSLNLLRAAGVDMTSPEPVQATTQLLDEIVTEMEEIAGQHIS